MYSFFMSQDEELYDMCENDHHILVNTKGVSTNRKVIFIEI